MAGELESLIGRKLGGQFEVLGKIGQGGMGAVFKARDASLDRLVAVKVMLTNPLEDQTSVERFMREAKGLAKLSHPNLIHIYQVGSEENLHYFAMEYLPGETLTARLRRTGPVRAEQAGRYLGQILAALHHIHMSGLIHRDVKSGNVMLVDERRAVLMDFGLAKDIGQSGLTTAGVVLGTPDYMAPEQCEGGDVDCRADIYSFGIVMYETMAGRVPFVGKSAMAVLRQHLDSPVPDLEAAWPDAPQTLCSVIRRCLQKKPEDRYATVPCLAMDLSAHWPTPELSELAGFATGATVPGMAAAGAAGTGKTAQAAATKGSVYTAPTVIRPKPGQPGAAAPSGAWKWVLGAAAVVLLLLVLLVALRGPRRPRMPKGATAVFLRTKEGEVVRAAWERYDPQTGRLKVWLYNPADRKWDEKAFTPDEFSEKFGLFFPTTEEKLFDQNAKPPERPPDAKTPPQ